MKIKTRRLQFQNILVVCELGVKLKISWEFKSWRNNPISVWRSYVWRQARSVARWGLFFRLLFQKAIFIPFLNFVTLSALDNYLFIRFHWTASLKPYAFQRTWKTKISRNHQQMSETATTVIFHRIEFLKNINKSSLIKKF